MINHKYIFIPKRDGEVDATLADINKAKEKLPLKNKSKHLTKLSI